MLCDENKSHKETNLHNQNKMSLRFLLEHLSLEDKQFHQAQLALKDKIPLSFDKPF